MNGTGAGLTIAIRVDQFTFVFISTDEVLIDKGQSYNVEIEVGTGHAATDYGVGFIHQSTYIVPRIVRVGEHEIGQIHVVLTEILIVEVESDVDEAGEQLTCKYVVIAIGISLCIDQQGLGSATREKILDGIGTRKEE